MAHVGRGCAAPREICMTFNTTAGSLIRHGHAREVDVVECLDLLAVAYDHHLVQFGENVREGVNFICNCCGCCCEAMIAARRFAIFNPVHTTNFLPEVDAAACNGCGALRRCLPGGGRWHWCRPTTPTGPRRKWARLNVDLCLGCGVCVRTCKTGGIRLKPRPARVITPMDGIHRAVVMAIERGNLQDLLFDNRGPLEPTGRWRPFWAVSSSYRP